MPMLFGDVSNVGIFVDDQDVAGDEDGDLVQPTSTTPARPCPHRGPEEQSGTSSRPSSTAAS